MHIFKSNKFVFFQTVYELINHSFEITSANTSGPGGLSGGSFSRAYHSSIPI